MKFINYIAHQIQDEYHNLSLWYFVSFMVGIIIFFTYLYQTNDILVHNDILDYTHHISPAILVVVSVIILVGLSKFYRHKNLIAFFIINCILACVFGLVTSYIRMLLIDTKPINHPITAQIQGKVDLIKPTLRGTQITIIDVNLSKIKPRNQHITNLQKVRINISNKLATKISHDNIITLKAKLFPLQDMILPNSYDFGFYMYMDAIEATGYALNAPRILSNIESSLENYVSQMRKNIYHRLINALGDINGNIVAAILIGETKAIPDAIANNMRDSGIAHILSVSGLHLSLVAMIFFVCSRVLLNCSNYLSYHVNIKIVASVIAIIGSFVYLKITGSHIAATRSFIMTSIFIISTIIGREIYPIRSVMIAAFLILLFLPEYILHPSFQLSFTAVLCLISGYALSIKRIKPHNTSLETHSSGVFFAHTFNVIHRIKLYVYTNIYSTFLAGIITTPFVCYHFYKFATYAVIMNLIAVPLMSFCIMPVGLVSLMLMMLCSSNIIDNTILQLLNIFIDVIVVSSSYILDLPYAVLRIGHISEISLICFSFGFLWSCLLKTRLRIVGMLIMIISILTMLQVNKPLLIYDHHAQIIGVQKSSGDLELYTNHKLSNFIRNYWASWYGQENIKLHYIDIKTHTLIFILNTKHIVAFNDQKCLHTDVQIITSKTLKCYGNNILIDYNNLLDCRHILIYEQKQGLSIKCG